MRRCTGWMLGIALCVSTALVVRADPTPGKVIHETWDAAYLGGGKVGFYHTTVREVERDGQKLLRTLVELDLSIHRYQAVARVRMETGNDETPEGKVLGIVMRQYLGDQPQLTLTGVVEDGQLHVRTADGRIDKRVPWDDKVVGLYGQEHLFQERKVNPGDHFTFRSYEPTINSVITVRAEVKDPEDVEVLGTTKRLLRVEAVPDKVQGPQGPVPLPSMTAWLGKDLLPLRTEMEVPGLGKIELYRTTRELALAPGTGHGPGIEATMISLNRSLPASWECRSAVYRIRVKGDEEPATVFAQDERQTVKNVQGETLELNVHAVRAPQPGHDGAAPREEFTRSCYYINSDDARVQEEARRAVGQEKDPWRKAQLIERWVYINVKHDDSVEFTGADKVAEKLRGDCRHKAMLAAAMCRAVGVPSRTAVGLVAAQDSNRKPAMAFHMWTEVWVAGQWLAIDGTLGQGSVGADHIKIADHSWYETQSLTPLLPVARVLGKATIEVVRVNEAD